MELIAVIDESSCYMDEEGKSKEIYIASIPQMPGLVESGETKEEAFYQLMISLKVKILFDSGLQFKLKEV